MSATQKFFSKLFAALGTKTVVPDATQPDGTVSYEAGYGADYQRATGDPLIKNIERDKFNQLLYDITLALHELQTRGFPEFIAAADNGGVAWSYDANSFVYWPTDGNVYRSVVSGNTTDPSNTANWQLWLPANSTGGIEWFPGTAAPTGYVKANGALLSRASYPQLYAYAQASGNMAVSDAAWTSGQFSPGDGATTFRIPDVRGYGLRAYDDGRGIDSGRVIGSVQGDQLLAHSHGVTDTGHTHVVTDPSHTHVVTDPGHGHGVFDGGHSHSVSDPTHVHGLSDPGHSHSVGEGTASPSAPSLYASGDDYTANVFTYSSTSSNGTGMALASAYTSVALFSATTGVTVAGNGSGISLAAHATGVTIASGTTGLAINNSAGGSEVRVKNIALLGCIRFR